MGRIQEEAEARRRHIVAAALRRFHRRGMAHTTFAPIVQAAGVTRGAIYRHLAGTEHLCRTIRESRSLPLPDRREPKLLGGTRAIRSLASRGSARSGNARALRTATQVARFELVSFDCEYAGALAAERRMVRRVAAADYARD